MGLDREPGGPREEGAPRYQTTIIFVRNGTTRGPIDNFECLLRCLYNKEGWAEASRTRATRGLITKREATVRFSGLGERSIDSISPRGHEL